LHNKPIGCGASGAYAPGPDDEEEEEAWKERASGGPPSLGTLEDTLRKSPDTGISLHGGPFPAEGNVVCGEGSYTVDFDG
jgi:hypothetical protein